MKFLFVVEPLSYEWLGIMYVSAVLKKFGLETKLFVIGEDIANILEWEPDFVSVFGGPHPTYFPQVVNETGVDYIVRGEAIVT